MSIRKTFLHFALLVSVCAVACAMSIFRTYAPIAETSGDSSINITPITAQGGNVKYYCFDNPVSVYAGDDGITVAGNGTATHISDRGVITAQSDVDADKLYRYVSSDGNAIFIALYNGKISYFSGNETGTEFSASGVTGNYCDFDVENDTLYAITDNTLVCATISNSAIDGDTANIYPLSSNKHFSLNASTITVSSGKVFIAVNAVYGNKQDICVTEQPYGNLTPILMQSDGIFELTSGVDSIYALTRGEITCYKISVAGGLYKTTSTIGTQITSIYAYGDYVYALDSLNSIKRYSANLDTAEVLFASGSEAHGFFDIPSDMTAKNHALYIADTMNGRIAIYKDDIEYASRQFDTPVSVAADNSGTVYVAYDYNKIGIFRNGIFSAEPTVITDGRLGIIKQIAASDGILYILADSGLWKRLPGGTPELIDNTITYKTISLSIGRNKLFALADSGIMQFDNGTPTTYATVADAISFAIDLNGTAFALKNDKIVRIATDGTQNEFTLALEGKPYTLGGKAGSIVICTVTNEFTARGDVLVLDTYKHRLYKTQSATLGAKTIDENYIVPDVKGDTSISSAPQNTGIVRTALGDTQVFPIPAESEPIYTISDGRNVIVPYYAIEDAVEYSLVLIDDTANNKLIQGYVYNSKLSSPVLYSPPPNTTCTVFIEATPIYKWPSRHAKAITGFSVVQKSAKLDMLDFVRSYRDDYGYYWYRVKLENDLEDDADGYIPAINVTTSDYTAANILPDYNGEIVAYNGVGHAQTYAIENGNYVAITGVTLPVGTKVEVVGAYDSSKYYTQIKFLDDESHKTITCYVETVHVRFNGVNIVILVAITVIIITVILAAIIIMRASRAKKRFRDKEDRI